MEDREVSHFLPPWRSQGRSSGSSPTHLASPQIPTLKINVYYRSLCTRTKELATAYTHSSLKTDGTRQIDGALIPV